jgi:hypothetical protein
MSILSSYTFSVEYSHALLFENMIKKDVLSFLKEIECLENIKTYKLLSEIETGGQNLSLQLFFKDIAHYDLFEANHKLSFLALFNRTFSGNYVYFQSLLEAF